MGERRDSSGPVRLGARQILFLAAVGAIGIALSSAIWWHLHREEEKRLDEEARITADQVELRLEAWIDSRVRALSFVEPTLDASGGFEEEAFRDGAKELRELFPGFQAVNWVDAEGVIRIVVPVKGNQPALGKDLVKEHGESVHSALVRARETSTTTRSPALELIQGKPGLGTYHPVETDDGELAGFVNGVFRIKKLIGLCLAEDRLQRDFRYVLEEADGVVAYASANADPTGYADWPHRADAQVRCVDCDWTLHLAPSEARHAAATSAADEVVFVAGVLGTLLIVWLLRGRLIRREALQRSEELHRSLISDVLDASRVGIIILDAERRVVWLNEAFTLYFGLSAGHLIGTDIRGVVRERLREDLVDDAEAFVRRVFARARPEGPPYEFRVLPGAGREGRWLEHRSQPIASGLFAGGRIDHFYDVTRRKEAADAQSHLMTRERDLETQLRQAQKMEAVGKLAGGVAHDFNNILQVILGRAHQLLSEAKSGSREAESLVEVVEASEKAAGLTRQLLAFGRRQHLERKLIEPTRLVRDHVKMLRRLIGEDIELELHLGEDIGFLRADPTQLEQVLMNLCVNSRDAMPDGGRITITTEAVREIQGPPADVGDARPPECYVKVSVTDNGTGISAADIDRVFEPFFSTKEPGQGSGLGLSTVYGIVHQHDGFLEIESLKGQGTTICVYLPAVDDADIAPTEAMSEPDTDGAETVLVVEDDPSVRGLVIEALTDAGYSVHTATDGEEALELLRASAGSIDLLFSDVVMPKMGGVALVEALRTMDADVRVLLTSGYGEDTLHAGVDVPFLAKPYSPSTMLQRIREVLDA